jgi:hypothetical protein
VCNETLELDLNAGLFPRLADGRLLRRLPRLEPSARIAPQLPLEHQQDAAALVEDRR